MGHRGGIHVPHCQPGIEFRQWTCRKEGSSDPIAPGMVPTEWCKAPWRLLRACCLFFKVPRTGNLEPPLPIGWPSVRTSLGLGCVILIGARAIGCKPARSAVGPDSRGGIPRIVGSTDVPASNRSCQASIKCLCPHRRALGFPCEMLLWLRLRQICCALGALKLISGPPVWRPTPRRITIV